MKLKLILLLTVAAAVTASGTANAAIVINIAQVGANVVATGSGSFITDGLSDGDTENWSVLINGARAGVLVGTQTDNVRYTVGLSSGPGFGIANSFYFADQSSGDTFGIYGKDPAIHLPVAYVSGASLSGSSTFNNLTLDAMGLVKGTYVYSSANDQVTVNVGAGGVPEPASWALMLGGFGLAGAAVRRRRETPFVTYI